MALLHRTTLVPNKLELLSGWAPTQPWFAGERDAPLATVASFRFDDPDGQVGVETLLIRAGDGAVLQVPLTYRNEELPGATAWFIGTMEHGVLGTRWVYDGVGDPVYRDELARVVLTGGTQVQQWIEIDGVMTEREPTALVIGSGSETAPELDGLMVEVVRRPVEAATDGLTHVGMGPVLTGTWTDHPEPTILAFVAAQ
jgi:hypothetical protein